jgi:hypothetical protein
MPSTQTLSDLWKPCGVGLLMTLAAKGRAYIQGPEWVKVPSSYSGRRQVKKYLATPLGDERIDVSWLTTAEGSCPQPRAGRDAVFSFSSHPTDQDKFLVWVRRFKKVNPYR